MGCRRVKGKCLQKEAQGSQEERVREAKEKTGKFRTSRDQNSHSEHETHDKAGKRTYFGVAGFLLLGREAPLLRLHFILFAGLRTRLGLVMSLVLWDIISLHDEHYRMKRRTVRMEEKC